MSPPTNTCISAIYSCQIIWQILQKFKKVRNTVNANTDLVRAMILNKGNAKRDVSPRLKIRPWPWPWKSIGFQILLRTKYVPSLVNIHWWMLILECSQGCYGRTDGSVPISLCNFVGEGIITCSRHDIAEKLLNWH